MKALSTWKLSAISTLAPALIACGGAYDESLSDELYGQTSEALTLNGYTVEKIEAHPVTTELQFCGGYVLNNQDSGSGSLRNAIANPPAWGPICFDSRVFNAETPEANRTISLESRIDITKNVTVVGPSASILTVRAGAATGVFSVAPGVKAKLTKMTISDGTTRFGGGIYNGGSQLVLDNVALRDNAADAGGAIYNAGGLLVKNSTIADNSASLNGGGIYAYYGSHITLQRTRLENNVATQSGGAIAKIDGDMVIEHRSTVKNNVAQTGGGIFNRSGHLDLVDAYFESNQAFGAGGGLYNVDYGVTTVTLDDTVFAGNLAGTVGGGIANASRVRLSLVGSSVVRYNAAANGGGISGGQLTNAVASGNVHSNTPNDIQ